jgi:hypothetical protein
MGGACALVLEIKLLAIQPSSIIILTTIRNVEEQLKASGINIILTRAFE